ncbi:hypothetical protein SNEBB_002559 [Seison nebaliae]|nr:hypothetical protein SNEBB_002559 [Seison nebaliae]
MLIRSEGVDEYLEDIRKAKKNKNRKEEIASRNALGSFYCEKGSFQKALHEHKLELKLALEELEERKELNDLVVSEKNSKTVLHHLSHQQIRRWSQSCIDVAVANRRCGECLLELKMWRKSFDYLLEYMEIIDYWSDKLRKNILEKFHLFPFVNSFGNFLIEKSRATLTIGRFFLIFSSEFLPNQTVPSDHLYEQIIKRSQNRIFGKNEKIFLKSEKNKIFLQMSKNCLSWTLNFLKNDVWEVNKISKEDVSIMICRTYHNLFLVHQNLNEIDELLLICNDVFSLTKSHNFQKESQKLFECLMETVENDGWKLRGKWYEYHEEFERLLDDEYHSFFFQELLTREEKMAFGKLVKCYEELSGKIKRNLRGSDEEHFIFSLLLQLARIDDCLICIFSNYHSMDDLNDDFIMDIFNGIYSLNQLDMNEKNYVYYEYVADQMTEMNLFNFSYFFYLRQLNDFIKRIEENSLIDFNGIDYNRNNVIKMKELLIVLGNRSKFLMKIIQVIFQKFIIHISIDWLVELLKIFGSLSGTARDLELLNLHVFWSLCEVFLRCLVTHNDKLSEINKFIFTKEIQNNIQNLMKEDLKYDNVEEVLKFDWDMIEKIYVPSSENDYLEIERLNDFPKIYENIEKKRIELDEIKSKIPDRKSIIDYLKNRYCVEVNEELSTSKESIELNDQRINRRLDKERNDTLKLNEKGETVLHVAAQENDIERCEEIIGIWMKCKEIDGNVDLNQIINSHDYGGWTPLHEAANHGHDKVVEILINYGGDVNDIGDEKCFHGITPLHDASMNGHIDCVNLMMKRDDCDLVKIDNDGNIAYDHLYQYTRKSTSLKISFCLRQMKEKILRIHPHYKFKEDHKDGDDQESSIIKRKSLSVNSNNSSIPCTIPMLGESVKTISSKSKSRNWKKDDNDSDNSIKSQQFQKKKRRKLLENWEDFGSEFQISSETTNIHHSSMLMDDDIEPRINQINDEKNVLVTLKYFHIELVVIEKVMKEETLNTDIFGIIDEINKKNKIKKLIFINFIQSIENNSNYSMKFYHHSRNCKKNIIIILFKYSYHIYPNRTIYNLQQLQNFKNSDFPYTILEKIINRLIDEKIFSLKFFRLTENEFLILLLTLIPLEYALNYLCTSNAPSMTIAENDFQEEYEIEKICLISCNSKEDNWTKNKTCMNILSKLILLNIRTLESLQMIDLFADHKENNNFSKFIRNFIQTKSSLSSTTKFVSSKFITIDFSLSELYEKEQFENLNLLFNCFNQNKITFIHSDERTYPLMSHLLPHPNENGKCNLIAINISSKSYWNENESLNIMELLVHINHTDIMIDHCLHLTRNNYDMAIKMFDHFSKELNKRKLSLTAVLLEELNDDSLKFLIDYGKRICKQFTFDFSNN